MLYKYILGCERPPSNSGKERFIGIPWLKIMIRSYWWLLLGGGASQDVYMSCITLYLENICGMFIGVIWRECCWLGCFECLRHDSTVIYYVCLVLGNRMETATQPQCHHPTIWSNAQTSTKILLDKKHKTNWNHFRHIARISTPMTQQQQQQQQASLFSLQIIHNNPYEFFIPSFHSSETWTEIRWAVSRSVVRPWLIPRIRRCVRASKTLDFHRGSVCTHTNIGIKYL